jgi:hypothetical protein
MHNARELLRRNGDLPRRLPRKLQVATRFRVEGAFSAVLAS